jgi:hypothetical protein
MRAHIIALDVQNPKNRGTGGPAELSPGPSDVSESRAQWYRTCRARPGAGTGADDVTREGRRDARRVLPQHVQTQRRLTTCPTAENSGRWLLRCSPAVAATAFQGCQAHEEVYKAAFPTSSHGMHPSFHAPLAMNGLDIFSILTGIIGVSTVVVPLCQWLSPARRLRALDEAMRRVEHLLATMQQEGLVAYRTIDSVQEAHERLFRCGITRVGFILIASTDHASHRVRFTLVRLRFRVATARSIFHVVRLVFSGLPFEISRLRHHLEALHNQLQVSIGCCQA